jgi:hypothetical protein
VKKDPSAARGKNGSRNDCVLNDGDRPMNPHACMNYSDDSSCTVSVSLRYYCHDE